MNILILGDANSPYVYEFVKRIPQKNKICILSITEQNRYISNYEEKHIKVISIQPCLAKYTLNKFNLVPTLMKISKEICDKISFGNRIDIMHVHYVEVNSMICLALLWLKAKKRILTYWGSDLFRAKQIDYRLMTPFLWTATSIVFMIREQYDFFVDIYKKYVKKLHIIDMGTAILEVIDDVNRSMSKEDCKKAMGFPKEKIVIHVGYNKSQAQQHLELVKEITLLSKDVISKIFVVLPWGEEKCEIEKEYRDNIEKVLNSVNVEYIFCTKFMSGKELAMFRRSCDIFLYGQTTDAMSDSCLEYVYAGGMFFCPTWLWNNYRLINSFPKCYCYSNFTEIGFLLGKVLDSGELMKENIDEDERKIIQNNKSWNCLMPQWLKLYE